MAFSHNPMMTRTNCSNYCSMMKTNSMKTSCSNYCSMTKTNSMMTSYSNYCSMTKMNSMKMSYSNCCSMTKTNSMKTSCSNYCSMMKTNSTTTNLKHSLRPFHTHPRGDLHPGKFSLSVPYNSPPRIPCKSFLFFPLRNNPEHQDDKIRLYSNRFYNP